VLIGLEQLPQYIEDRLRPRCQWLHLRSQRRDQLLHGVMNDFHRAARALVAKPHVGDALV
jgi:hypothetical protein